MPNLDMYQVDAFADRPFTGNPAAVLVTDASLPDALMQAIAAENNLAETAYVTPAGDGWAIRWFTPLTEAAFCGHATLAAAHVMAVELNLGDRFLFRTQRVGDLLVERVKEGTYRLDLPLFRPELVPDVPDALEDLFPGCVRSVFRNFENLFVALDGPETVAAYSPDLSAISRVAPSGLVITARGGTGPDGAPVDFVSRYFAPGAGIPEDPVTGSTHATLAPYWAERLGKDEMRAYQASPRGGLVGCRIAGDRVVLTGQAVTVIAATLRLPD